MHTSAYRESPGMELPVCPVIPFYPTTPSSYPAPLMLDLRGESYGDLLDVHDPQFCPQNDAAIDAANERMGEDYWQAQVSRAETDVFADWHAREHPIPPAFLSRQISQDRLFSLRDAGIAGELALWLLGPQTRKDRARELYFDLWEAEDHRKASRHANSTHLQVNGRQFETTSKPADYSRLQARRSFNRLLDTEEGREELIDSCLEYVENFPWRNLSGLVQVIDEGKLAQEALVRRHMPLLFFTARGVRNAYNLSFPSRVSAGYEGLRDAVRSFDPAVGFTFAAYAVKKIAGPIVKAALLEDSQRLGVTPYELQCVRAVNKAIATLTQTLDGVEPTNEQIAAHMKKKPKTVEHYKALAYRCADVPLGMVYRGEDEATRERDTHDSRGAAIATAAEETSDVLSELLITVFAAAQLGPLEEAVLKNTFGVGAEQLSKDETAKVLGLTEDEVRAIDRSARRKIQKSPEATALLHRYLK